MILKYLIVGATGGLGEKVLAHFIATRPAHEYAAASTQESNRKLFEDRGIAFRRINYDEPEVLDTAFDGVENVLFVSTNTFDNDRRRRQHQNFVDAAARAKIKHVWYTSLAFGGFTSNSKATVQTAHLETEEMLRRSGLTFTSIREGLYTDAFPLMLNWFPESAKITLPTNEPMAMALRSELGEATARLMITGGHENEIVLLTAEAPIRPSEIVTVINETTHRQVEFERVSTEAFLTAHEEGDLGKKPKAFFESILTWYEDIEIGGLDHILDISNDISVCGNIT